MTLLVLMHRHRPAFEYDLMRVAGWGADALLSGAVSWNRLAMIAAELMRDLYSHSHAAIAGWAYVPNPADVLFANWIDATAAMNHRPGTVKPAPIHRPWEEAIRERPSLLVSAEQKQRRAHLRERLGLA